MAVEPNYFTCTLGQAQSLGLTQPHKTVNEFLDAKATEQPDLPAVGFAVPQKEQQWQYRLFTFADVHRGSCNLANHILSRHPELKEKRATVGLLCPSTPEFLFLWLALMRAGCAVLLIAPQCRALAIKALYEQCESAFLFYDEIYAEQASEAVGLAESQGAKIRIEKLPFDHPEQLDEFIDQEVADVGQPEPAVQAQDVAYLHHTSGTSSGIPKPVPQPHKAAVGVQPFLPHGRDAATFTTTPLFHGGIADLFRAWTSSALIWLFPGKSVPITSSNILKSLDIAEHATTDVADVAPVKYFSSVPYVLQMLDSDPAGTEALKSMDMVGVGGAALPAEVGDRLVSKGVGLISRYGSAECGFLMSSQRDFSKDGEWQYLRFPSDSKYLRLEDQGDGLCELVVLDGWPHMAKRNRDDGSYATSDLFVPHESISGAWKYHSRSDSQLTLITGKKFDPAPLEAAIATSDLLEDVLVFGNGEPYPGALLFRSAKAKTMSDEELLGQIWQTVEKLNRDSPDHAQLARGMLRPMRVPEQPLEKSSKGTIMRGSAEKAYKPEIEAAYHQEDDSAGEYVPDEEVQKTVHQIVGDIVHRKRRLSVSVDLFSYGVDSVAGMQIRSRLQRLLPFDSPRLPMTVVEDCGTVANLANLILKRRRGEKDDLTEKNDDLARMRELVDDFSNFVDSDLGSTSHLNGHANGTAASEVVVLTGATGALGAYVLHQYRQSPRTRRIYCLVRGADTHAARERINKALSQRKLPSLDAHVSAAETVVLPAQLSDSFLGLAQETYERVAAEVTLILHLAWSVNFRMRLHSFVKDHIGGVTNVINLALASPRERPPRLGFCSSVAAVGAYDKGCNGSIPETIISDPEAATGIGYSQSKWVAEQICARAGKETRLRGRLAVFRVGQLAGDRAHGVWNASEAWPLMLRSALATRCLPDLGEGEVLSWLPVDVAAAALVERMSVKDGGKGEANGGGGDGEERVTVWHIVNPHRTPTWRDLLGWLQGEGFEAVRPADWVKRLESLGEKQPEHPALKLLEHWRKAYGEGEGGEGAAEQGESTKKEFAVERTKERIASMREVKPVNEEYFGKLWAWIKSEM